MRVGDLMFPDSTTRSRNAFTLVELMIAIVLLSVLMVVTWGLLDVFRNQFERNQVRVERWQIVRSVHERIASDLQSCAVEPPSESRTEKRTSSGSQSSGSQSSDSQSSDSQSSDSFPRYSSTDERSPSESLMSLSPEDSFGQGRLGDVDNGGPRQWLVPVVGVEGDSNSLVLDVFAPRPRDVNWQDPNRPIVRDSIRRVVYSYRSTRDAALADGVPGLLRCELTRREILALKHFASSSLSLEPVLRELRVPWIPEPKALGVGQPDNSNDEAELSFRDDVRMRDFVGRDFDQRIDYLPEIRKFRLRYFDGVFWTSSWSSKQQKQIPVAVELSFDLEDPYWLQPTELELQQQAALELLEEETVETEPLDPRQQSTLQEPPEGFRFLIYLRTPEPSSLEEDSMVFGDGQFPLSENRSGVLP